MKQIVFISLIAFLSLGCVKKTITLSSPRPATVIYEEPIVYHEDVVPYKEPVVIHETQPHYEVPIPRETPRPRPSVSVVETSLDPVAAYDMLQGNPMVMLLDVRTKQEQITDGKIANSLLIPLDVLSKNFNKLDRAKKIMVYCHTGNRSREALNILFRNGFDAVEIKGGIQKWKASHLPVRYGR